MSDSELPARAATNVPMAQGASADDDAADERDVAAAGRDADADADARDFVADDAERQDAEDFQFAARDRTAAARDRRAAAARDRRAAARDKAADAREAAARGGSEEGSSNRALSAGDRAAAALDRRDEATGATAALARDAAAEARDVASARRRAGKAAGDRTHAADDRAAAALDRAGSATDRQVATDQLRDAAQALAAIVNSSRDAVIARTIDGIITSWNEGATLVYGQTADDMVGRSFEAMVPPEAVAEERERHARVAAGAAESGIRLARVGADGRRIEVVMSMSPIYSDEGAVTGVASISRPISATEHHEARFASLLEAAPDAIVCVDATGTIVAVNAEVTQMFGYEREQLLGAELEVLLPEESRSRHVGLRTAFLLNPEGRAIGVGLSLSGRRRDGSVFPIEVSLAQDHAQAETIVIAVVRDITERVEAAEALQQAEMAEAVAVAANQAKNLFLSRMSHELRTPLNAVLGFGQLLEMRLTEPDDADAVDQILKGGRHLLDLINDALDIARIEAGEMSTIIEAVSVGGVVDDVMQLMATLAGAAGVTLTAAAQSTDCMVLADPNRLRQILLNLLANAVKYNRPGGRVWVERQVREGKVAITVHDDGPGIPPELQGRLFTPFDRLGAEASGVEGAGIGLALTRSLAELMGGTLTVDSMPGRGSAFTVTVLQAQPALQALPAPDDGVVLDTRDRTLERILARRTLMLARGRSTVPGIGLPAGSCRLLYIEDNGPNVKVLEHVMKLRPEWRLLHAGLGGLGVDLAGAYLPDLILLDLHLPDRSGADVLRQLKSASATSGLPVVILTADATPGQARHLVDIGAAGYLTKPIDVAELLELLDRTSALRAADTHD